MGVYIEALEGRRLFSAGGTVYMLHSLKQSVTVPAGETSPPIRIEALDVHRHRLRSASGDVSFELILNGVVEESLGTMPLEHGLVQIPGVTATLTGAYVVAASMAGVTFGGAETVHVVGAAAVALSLETSLYVGQFETVRLRVLDQYGNFTTSNSTVRIASSDPASAGAFIQVHAYGGGRNVGLVMRHGKAVAVKILNGQCPMQLGTQATGDGQVTVHLAASDPHIAGIDLTFPFTVPGLT